MQLCQTIGINFHDDDHFKLSSIGFDDQISAPAAGQPAIPASAVGDTIDSDAIGQNPSVDTVPGSVATSIAIANGSSVRGYINSSGDQDWYRVNLVAGQQYTFAESGFGQGAIRDPFVRLYNPSGILVASDDDSGPLTNARLTYIAASTGTYYVSAGGFGSGTGQYLLTANTGANPYFPVVPVSDVADYLTHTYWEVNGQTARKWASGSITYNVQGLEPERAALAGSLFRPGQKFATSSASRRTAPRTSWSTTPVPAAPLRVPRSWRHDIIVHHQRGHQLVRRHRYRRQLYVPDVPARDRSRHRARSRRSL